MTTTPTTPPAARDPRPMVDDWVAIEEDGTVTIFSGKVELGTGVRTALAQIAAEELGVPLDRIRMVMGDTGRTPNEGGTTGSKTIQRAGAALRQAAAEARLALLERASERLDAALDELTVEDGVVSVRVGPPRSISYADLHGGRSFDRPVSGRAPLKQPDEYRLVGRPAPRLDIPGKVTGQPSFVQDLRLPGMLHGRIVRPPSPGATLLTLDDRSTPAARVVRLGNFVGVVAAREEQAVKAAKQLTVTWEETATLPPQEVLFQTMQAQPTTDEVILEKGAVETALTEAAIHQEATYYQPFHAHASLGPSCAVADHQGDHLTVWCSSQAVFSLRGALAELLEMPLESIQVIHMEGAGCYGHNGFDDVAADAALLSRAVGKPVRVQWSREEEFAWEPKAPAMVIQIRGGLNEAGQVNAWDFAAWSPTHSGRPREGADLLAAQLITGQPAPWREGFGGGSRNAPTDYTFANNRVTMRWLPHSVLRTSSMRGLGAPANSFANESFMDELAHAAGSDPLEFRLRHLDDPRAIAVLEAAARQADWGSPLPTGQGQGIAFARYENNTAYVAAVAAVAVDQESGAIRVVRLVVAHDCGLIINPDGLKNQIEGNIIQALSRALKEEITFNERQVTSLDWESYPILTFSEIPEIEVILLDRPDQPSVGAGEPATVVAAPAVANAVFAASGARLRRIPFTPKRVLAALRSA